MTTVIADCETDGLLADMKRFWTLQIGDADGSDSVLYADCCPPDLAERWRDFGLTSPIRPVREGLDRLRAADRYVFHNGLSFDMPAINHFFPGTIERDKLLDTLIMARLQNPEERGNSLKALGERLGILKGEYTGDFQQIDEELLRYAPQDVIVTRAVWHQVKPVLEWGSSCRLEHDTAYAISLQERNGFRFDVPAAQQLDAELRGELAELTASMRDKFPPIWTRDGKGVFTPKGNNKTRGYVAGAPLCKVKLQTFEPSSRAQLARRLVRRGWRPKAFGADGTPSIDEAILAALPYPEAKAMVRYYELAKKIGMLADGKNGWLKMVQPDGRIHGRVNSNGAATGRMSHFAPNVAQADKDKRMRSLWLPRAGWKLVGCDAEGLEARMLGHYLAKWDGGAFSDRVVNGKKDDKSDVHSVNLAACRPLGLVSRDGAKTLLYALMYGAGDAKLGHSLKLDCRNHGAPAPKIPNPELGKLVRRALAKSMLGMDKLTDAVKAKAKARGHLVGLDGRRLFVRSEHSALNTLLQGGGAIVMKKALCLFMAEADQRGLQHGVDFGLCAAVHDEQQFETRPELAEDLGALFASCITNAGTELGVKCPLDGAFDVGDNWSCTH